MTDYTHLDALGTRLQNELRRLASAKTDAERALRTVWVDQIQREFDAEKHRLGLDLYDHLTDDQLFKELTK